MTLGKLVVEIIGDKAKLTEALRASEQETKSTVGRMARIIDENVQTFRRLGTGLSLLGAAINGALLLSIRSATTMGDEIARLSKITGQSAEELQKLAYAAELSDASFQAVTTGLRNLARNMVDAARGSKEAQSLFQDLGVSVVDANGQLRNSIEVLKDVADRFSTIQDPAYLAGMTLKLFGRSADELLPVLKLGRAGIEELGREAERLGLILPEKTIRGFDKLGDAVWRIEKQFKTLAQTWVAELLPALQAISNTITQVIAWFQKLEDPTKKTIAVIIALAGALAAIAGPSFIFIGYLPQIAKGLQMVWDWTTKLIPALAGLKAGLAALAAGSVIAGLVGLGIAIYNIYSYAKQARQSIEDIRKIATIEEARGAVQFWKEQVQRYQTEFEAARVKAPTLPEALRVGMPSPLIASVRAPETEAEKKLTEAKEKLAAAQSRLTQLEKEAAVQRGALAGVTFAAETEEEKRRKKIQEVIQEMQNQLRVIDEQAKIYKNLGIEYDATSETANVLQGALEQLLELGLSPQHPEIRKIISALRDLVPVLGEAKSGFEGWYEAVMKLSPEEWGVLQKKFEELRQSMKSNNIAIRESAGKEWNELNQRIAEGVERYGGNVEAILAYVSKSLKYSAFTAREEAQKTLGEMDKQLEVVDKLKSIYEKLGEKYDDAGEKSAILRGTLEELLKKGLDPQDPAIQKIIKALKDLGPVLDKTKTEWEEWYAKILGLDPKAFGMLRKTFEEINTGLKSSDIVIRTLAEDKMGKVLSWLTESVKKYGGDFEKAIKEVSERIKKELIGIEIPPRLMGAPPIVVRRRIETTGLTMEDYARLRAIQQVWEQELKTQPQITSEYEERRGIIADILQQREQERTAALALTKEIEDQNRLYTVMIDLWKTLRKERGAEQFIQNRIIPALQQETDHSQERNKIIADIIQKRREERAEASALTKEIRDQTRLYTEMIDLWKTRRKEHEAELFIQNRIIPALQRETDGSQERRKIIADILEKREQERTEALALSKEIKDQNRIYTEMRDLWRTRREEQKAEQLLGRIITRDLKEQAEWEEYKRNIAEQSLSIWQRIKQAIESIEPQEWVNVIQSGIQELSQALQELGDPLADLIGQLVGSLKVAVDDVGRIIIDWKTTVLDITVRGLTALARAIVDLFTAGTQARQEYPYGAYGEVKYLDLSRMIQNYKEWNQNFQKLISAQRAKAGMAIGGGLLGGILGFLFPPFGLAAWIGGLLGAGVGALAGGALGGAMYNRQIEELKKKLEDTFQKIAEALGTAISNIADALGRAFSAETYQDFLRNFATNLEDVVKQALIKAFMAGEIMRPLLQSLSDFITVAVWDGVIDAAEKLKLTELFKQVIETAKPFWEALQQFDFAKAVGAATDAVNEFTEAIRNAPTGFKIAYYRWEATLPAYQEGGVVGRTGVALLHAGETVIPAGEAGGIHVHLEGATIYGMDDFERKVETAVSKAARRAGLGYRGLARAGAF